VTADIHVYNNPHKISPTQMKEKNEPAKF